MEGRAIGPVGGPPRAPLPAAPSSPPPPAAGGRGAWGLVLKAGVSVALLALLFSRVDRAQLAAALRGASLPLILLCLPLYAVGQTLSTWRWQILLGAEGIRVPLRRLLALYLEGMFFNLCLPTAVGGDVVRGYRIWHLSRAGEGAVASILVERVTGFVAMIGIAVVATAAAFRSGTLGDPRIGLFVAAVAAALAAAVVLISSPWALGLAERLAGRRAAGGIFQAVRRFGEAVQRYRGHRAAVGAALGISLAFQMLLIFLVFLVAVALHLPVTFGQFLIFIPILNVLSMLPISLGGLGVREGGAVILLGKVGVDPAGALTLSLLWFAIVAVASLPGGIIFLWGGHRAKARPAAVVAE
ncbi:MAG TPA: lysylphosphatidylglycerol synthase transmembrane domain-containing protein [Candidatus Sulfotelmatobacter sp.]|nr:lysylphosphatidylglycerol synthase transmembrane domain-containing protein [Candidatus Sulfotelmatobacter sp.]